MKTHDSIKTFAAVLILAGFAASQTVWTGGLDTAWYTANKTQERFTITTAEQLAGLAYLVKGTGGSGGKGGSGYAMSGKTFTLGGDVALNALKPEEYKTWGDKSLAPANKWTAIGDSANPFQGVFDGAGFFVRGVYIDTALSYQGLFGRVNRGGAIKRLRVADSFVRGVNYVGGLVGSDSGTITDCYAKAMVEASGGYAGALAGLVRGAVTNSYATGDVKGVNYAGGLAGAVVKDTVRDCYAVGSVAGSGGFAGGLVGLDSGYMIINSYAGGSVSGAGVYAGGLAGKSYSVISNSYASADVSGGDSVGGLVGGKYRGEIKNCYASGKVSGSGAYTGGLVGWPDRAASNPVLIIYGYYNKDVSGSAGSVGIPKTDAELRSGKFIELLNTAAYALRAAKWVPGAGGYPSLGSGPVPDSVFAACFAGGGGGSENNPFMIADQRNLENLAILVNCGMDMAGRHFKLAGDITLVDLDRDAGGWTPIGKYGAAFNGGFNGGGFSIGGLVIDDETDAGRHLGLFGRLGGGASIKNLGIIEPDISGYGYIGALAGRNAGTVTKCFVKNGKIKAVGGVKGAGGVGGLVGVDSGGTITSSYAVAEITGSANMAGGLVGWNAAGSRIAYCYAMGSINVIGDDVGGLAGRNDVSSISDSYAAFDDPYPPVGISGYQEGSAVGGAAIGGLVGANVDASVARCYSVGKVNGRSSVGGLVGFNLGANSRIDSSYYYRIDADAEAGSDYGVSKTPEELKLTATYRGWKFYSVWMIDEETQDYPYPYLLSIGGNPTAVSVLKSDRTLPPPSSGGAASASPPPPLTYGLTAGPNPALGSAGVLNFFRVGSRLADSELSIYDASGNIVNKVKISDRLSAQSNRKVGSWNLTDAKGRKAPDGVYLVRGAIVGVDGKRESVSIIVGVVR